MEIPDTLCPICHARLKCEVCLDAKPDDLTVCVDCASVLVYGRNLGVQVVGEAEMGELLGTEPDTYRRVMDTVGRIRHINFVERSMRMN